jgi:hypothetical protein
MKRRLYWAAAVALSGTFMIASPVLACDTGRSHDTTRRHVAYHRWAGASSTTYVRAAQATIDEYHPFIESAGGFTAAYSMVRIQSGSRLYYAQAGWWEEWGIFGHDAFFEYGWVDVVTGDTSPCPCGEDQLGDPGGTAHAWKTVWTDPPGNGHHTFNFFRDSTMIGTALLDWSPKDGEVAAEMQYSDSQAPGDTSNHADYNWALAVVNGAWIDFYQAAPTNDQTAWYGDNKVSAHWFQMWDKAC